MTDFDRWLDSDEQFFDNKVTKIKYDEQLDLIYQVKALRYDFMADLEFVAIYDKFNSIIYLDISYLSYETSKQIIRLYDFENHIKDETIQRINQYVDDNKEELKEMARDNFNLVVNADKRWKEDAIRNAETTYKYNNNLHLCLYDVVNDNLINQELETYRQEYIINAIKNMDDTTQELFELNINHKTYIVYYEDGTRKQLEVNCKEYMGFYISLNELIEQNYNEIVQNPSTDLKAQREIKEALNDIIEAKNVNVIIIKNNVKCMGRVETHDLRYYDAIERYDFKDCDIISDLYGWGEYIHFEDIEKITYRNKTIYQKAVA